MKKRVIKFPIFANNAGIREPIFNFDRIQGNSRKYISFLQDVKGLNFIEARELAHKVYGN